MKPTYLDELNERRRAEYERQARKVTDAVESMKLAIPEVARSLGDLAVAVKRLTR